MHIPDKYPPDSKYIIVEPHYFPCLAYFACLQPHKVIVLEAHEEYKKKSYRNRCMVRAAQKVVSLSVPIRKKEGTQPISEVEIDYTGNWVKDHWGTLFSAYGKSPFFKEFAPLVESVLFKKHRLLFDLNHDILTICLKLLGWNTQILQTERYLETGSIPTDYRNSIHPKHPETWSQFYQPVPYLQNFGDTFEPNLSILDLLFNEGTRSTQILVRSQPVQA